MPEIYRFKCNTCGFYLGTGWGETTYVMDEKGKRIICPHPAEDETIFRVLGGDAPRDLIRARTGTLTDCVCLDCLRRFDLDLERDEKKCPRCGSSNIETIVNMVGRTCPKCGRGTIIAEDTGIEA